ncbi:hypothetical protein LINPERPRIM_LOCUS1532 [Linum perenne]
MAIFGCNLEKKAQSHLPEASISPCKQFRCFLTACFQILLLQRQISGVDAMWNQSLIPAVFDEVKMGDVEFKEWCIADEQTPDDDYACGKAGVLPGMLQRMEVFALESRVCVA